MCAESISKNVMYFNICMCQQREKNDLSRKLPLQINSTSIPTRSHRHTERMSEVEKDKQKGNITFGVRWSSQKRCHSPSSPPLSSRPISPSHLASLLHGCDKRGRSRVLSPARSKIEAERSCIFQSEPLLPHTVSTLLQYTIVQDL